MHRETVEKPISQYEFRESLVRSFTNTHTHSTHRQRDIDCRLVKMELMQACVFCKIAKKSIAQPGNVFNVVLLSASKTAPALNNGTRTSRLKEMHGWLLEQNRKQDDQKEV